MIGIAGLCSCLVVSSNLGVDLSIDSVLPLGRVGMCGLSSSLGGSILCTSILISLAGSSSLSSVFSDSTAICTGFLSSLSSSVLFSFGTSTTDSGTLAVVVVLVSAIFISEEIDLVSATLSSTFTGSTFSSFGFSISITGFSLVSSFLFLDSSGFAETTSSSFLDSSFSSVFSLTESFAWSFFFRF